MDSSGHPADSDGNPHPSDGNPHPRVIDFLGVSIAILTLILPVYTISIYSTPSTQTSPGLLIGRTGVEGLATDSSSATANNRF